MLKRVVRKGFDGKAKSEGSEGVSCADAAGRPAQAEHLKLR